jgi:hypothetical protein
METGLFEIQADQLRRVQVRPVYPASRDVVYALFGRAEPDRYDHVPGLQGMTNETEAVPDSIPKSIEPVVHPTAEFARCFLHLANLPNYALDRLCRYEATLWRQVRQILFALDALGRRKPQDRKRPFRIGSPQGLPATIPTSISVRARR